ncbi:hypothetical protein RRG08_052048 [Elysia crispata]|uniref:Uncharacterized protein n=1 Tax=Elysia crispata TaxID=231223 RepID=A0AAE1A481_9GAST|nr:hypothetical protein RRG08_052048 [Elysia crispata]
MSVTKCQVAEPRDLSRVYSTCEGIDFKGRRNLPLAKVKSSKGAETCHLRRQSCKRKAEDDLTERPRKIIVTEGQSMETDGLNQRDIDNVRKAMWRQRRKHQPKLPISRMDALRAISEIETRQDVKIVTDDETQIACVYSPSAMIRDGPSRPAKLSDRKKHDWMKSSIAEEGTYLYKKTVQRSRQVADITISNFDLRTCAIEKKDRYALAKTQVDRLLHLRVELSEDSFKYYLDLLKVFEEKLIERRKKGDTTSPIAIGLCGDDGEKQALTRCCKLAERECKTRTKRLASDTTSSAAKQCLLCPCAEPSSKKEKGLTPKSDLPCPLVVKRFCSGSVQDLMDTLSHGHLVPWTPCPMDTLSHGRSAAHDDVA